MYQIDQTDWARICNSEQFDVQNLKTIKLFHLKLVNRQFLFKHMALVPVYNVIIYCVAQYRFISESCWIVADDFKPEVGTCG